MEQVVTGILVSVAESKYNTFTGRDGTQVPAGSNFFAYVVPSQKQAPVKIKLNGEPAASAMGGHLGKAVEIQCRVFAQGSQLQYSAV